MTHGKKETNVGFTKEMDYLRGSYILGNWFKIVMEPVATCDLTLWHLLGEPATWEGTPATHHYTDRGRENIPNQPTRKWTFGRKSHSGTC